MSSSKEFEVPKTIGELEKYKCDPSSDTAGVQPMNISRRMAYERERCIGMTDEERAWRAQWLKDQILDHDEPKEPENYYRERYHLIRRIYRYPMDKFEKLLTPVLGVEAANGARHTCSKLAMGVVFVYAAFYYFKYNKHDWTRQGGWRVSSSRTTLFPGDKDFPNFDRRLEGNKYAVHGFDKSPI